MGIHWMPAAQPKAQSELVVFMFFFFFLRGGIVA